MLNIRVRHKREQRVDLLSGAKDHAQNKSDLCAQPQMTFQVSLQILKVWTSKHACLRLEQITFVGICAWTKQDFDMGLMATTDFGAPGAKANAKAAAKQHKRTSSFFFMSAATTPMPCLIATLFANSDAASCCFDSHPDLALVSMSSHHLKLPGGSFFVPRRIKRFRT